MIIAPYRDDCRQIVVMNPKGGCGKTTLATNLASHYALRGANALLIDNDPIGYSSRWLERRPGSVHTIYGMASHSAEYENRRFRPLPIPRGTDTIIIDTPAALERQQIAKLTHNADCILVPVIPSAFDLHYVTQFIAELLLITQFEKPVGVVANRTRKHTASLKTLLDTLSSFETPTVAVLRNTQNYVSAAELGLGIYELPRHEVRQDIHEMDRVVSWLDRLLTQQWHPTVMSAAS